MKRNVMESFTALLQKFGDHRIRAGRFQQFKPALAQRNHGHLHLFVRHDFFGGDLEVYRVTCVELEALIEAAVDRIVKELTSGNQR